MENNKIYELIIQKLKDNNIQKISDLYGQEHFLKIGENEYMIGLEVPDEELSRLEDYKKDFENLEEYKKDWHQVSEDTQIRVGFIYFPQITGHGISFSIIEQFLNEVISRANSKQKN